MNEIRVNQVISLLVKLDEMSLIDFGHEYTDFDLQGGHLLIDAKSRSARIALEMLLCDFLSLTVYCVDSCKLEIWFH